MRSFQKVEGSRRLSRKSECESYLPLVPSTVGRDDDDIGGGSFALDRYHGRRRFYYHRLPQQLLKLSVLKLDGSCFEVQIARKASISDLKGAIENIFIKSSKEEGVEISWSHVWGHFCLSYQETKLINDKESLQRLGIKDGDQLQFARHVSISYYPTKKHTRKSRFTSKHAVPAGESDADEESEEKNNKTHHPVKEAMVGHVNVKLSHFLKGCLSRSRPWSRTNRSEGRPCPSKLAGHCVKAGRKVMLLS